MEKKFKFRVVRKDANLQYNVVVDVELENKKDDETRPVFSVSASIGNGNRCETWGQCLKTVLSDYHFLKPEDEKLFKQIYSLWEKYHLNDMNAGTVKQEKALIEKFGGINASKYNEQCEYLRSIDLYEDEGHKFGMEWLYREIPNEDLNLIKSLFEK